MKPVRANSARVTTGGRWPRKGSVGWTFCGGMVWRASPAAVVQRSTLSTSPCTWIAVARRRRARQASGPVVIDVSAVAVVVGRTESIGPPSIDDSVGVSARRVSHLLPAEAVEHEQHDPVGIERG